MDISKFKNINGVFLTKELFFETALNKDNVLYTLKDHEHKGFPSLYQLYMETNDPTEYTFAMEYLGGWAHWKLLEGSTWFEPYLSRWREELHLRAKAQALAKVMKTAQADNKDSFAAQKYLIEKGYDKAAPNTKGRPTKQQVLNEAKSIALETKRVEEDLERLLN